MSTTFQTFSVRVTDEERRIFDEAAAVTDRSTTRLIVHCARIGAEAILAREARRCACGAVANGQPETNGQMPEMSAQ